jgi:sugar/nucleoside kinase (ribokinase family)
VALTHYDILVPGNYFCDLIFTGFPQFPALGSEVYTQGLTVTIGGALNTVIALHRLGVKVGWVGRIGNDIFSQYVLDTVEKEGLDTSLIKRVDAPFQRVTASLSYPHDRAFITYVDPAPSPIELVIEVQDKISFQHLHFTGFQLDSRTSEVLAAMKARGISVSMDCQDRPITLDTPGVRETIPSLAVFMPNAREAMQLTGTTSIEAAADELKALVPILIIKDGANGAFGWQTDKRIHVPSLSVIAVDTTGAGDVFNAGYLCASLEGKDLAECLRWGNVCGGLSTLGYGGTSTAPTRMQVEETNVEQSRRQP